MSHQRYFLSGIEADYDSTLKQAITRRTDLGNALKFQNYATVSRDFWSNSRGNTLRVSR